MHRRRFLAVSAVACCGPAVWAQPAASKEVEWLDEIRRRPAEVPPLERPLRPLLRDGKGGEIDSLSKWKLRRETLRREWLDFLGPLASGHLKAQTNGNRPAAPVCTTLGEEHVDGVTRRLIRYAVEDGQAVEAYVLIPDVARAAPGVVVFHSTVPESLRQPAGVEGAPEKAFAWQLAQRGCVTIAPRNYLWPENHRLDARGEAEKFRKRQPASRGMDRMLLDGLVAVDILTSLAEVDPLRIGCLGHSLGAKEVLYLAAFDERIRASVSSEGGVGVDFSNWHDLWYLGPDVLKPDFSRDHHELLALAAPHPFLLIGGDSADGDRSWPYIAAAMEVYRLYGPSPRLGLFNHRQGHSVPPVANQRALEWITASL